MVGAAGPILAALPGSPHATGESGRIGRAVEYGVFAVVNGCWDIFAAMAYPNVSAFEAFVDNHVFVREKCVAKNVQFFTQLS